MILDHILKENTLFKISDGVSQFCFFVYQIAPSYSSALKDFQQLLNRNIHKTITTYLHYRFFFLVDQIYFHIWPMEFVPCSTISRDFLNIFNRPKLGIQHTQNLLLLLFLKTCLLKVITLQQVQTCFNQIMHNYSSTHRTYSTSALLSKKNCLLKIVNDVLLYKLSEDKVKAASQKN